MLIIKHLLSYINSFKINLFKLFMSKEILTARLNVWHSKYMEIKIDDNSLEMMYSNKLSKKKMKNTQMKKSQNQKKRQEKIRKRRSKKFCPKVIGLQLEIYKLPYPFITLKLFNIHI